MVSPRVKFIVITVDELILVPIALILVYYFIPELLPFATVALVIGAIVFVAAKYYLIYPSLQEGSHALYDLEGMTGKVIDTVTKTSGKIKVGAEIWEARYDEGEIPIGAEVNVVSRESMKVRVVPKDMGND
jgi:membrane protein implicated in regulation of membrane protease activity